MSRWLLVMLLVSLGLLLAVWFAGPVDAQDVDPPYEIEDLPRTMSYVTDPAMACGAAIEVETGDLLWCSQFDTTNAVYMLMNGQSFRYWVRAGDLTGAALGERMQWTFTGTDFGFNGCTGYVRSLSPFAFGQTGYVDYPRRIDYDGCGAAMTASDTTLDSVGRNGTALQKYPLDDIASDVVDPVYDRQDDGAAVLLRAVQQELVDIRQEAQSRTYQLEQLRLLVTMLVGVLIGELVYRVYFAGDV